MFPGVSDWNGSLGYTLFAGRALSGLLAYILSSSNSGGHFESVQKYVINTYIQQIHLIHTCYNSYLSVADLIELR